MSTRITPQRCYDLVTSYLKTQPFELCKLATISKATGVPENQIDRDGSISKRHSFMREETDEGTLVGFAYIGATSEVPLKEPKVAFSSWVKWADRSSLKPEHSDWGGVYLFARFKSPTHRKSLRWPRIPKEVICVGESHNLGSRPLRGHNRIANYRQDFDDHKLRHLYLAVANIFESRKLLSHLLRRYTTLLEREAIWEYTKVYGTPPNLQREKRSRKS